MLKMAKYAFKQKKSSLQWLLDNTAAIMLLLLVVFNSIFTKNFFNANTLWNIINQSASSMFVALGMTVVIASGGINISMGSMMALTGMFCCMLIEKGYLGLGLIISLAAITMIGGLVGYAISKFKLQPMIATLGTSYVLRGIANVLSNGHYISIHAPKFTDLAYVRLFDQIPLLLFAILFIVIAMYLLLERTRFGTYVQAYGDNKVSAYISGIRPVLLLISVYAISGLLSGCGGLIETMRLACCDPGEMGKNLELDAIAATVIGGTPLSGGKPHVAGTMFGVFIMRLITVMVNMNNIQYDYSLIIKAGMVIFAVYLQSITPKLSK